MLKELVLAARIMQFFGYQAEPFEEQSTHLIETSDTIDNKAPQQNLMPKDPISQLKEKTIDQLLNLAQSTPSCPSESILRGKIQKSLLCIEIIDRSINENKVEKLNRPEFTQLFCKELTTEQQQKYFKKIINALLKQDKIIKFYRYYAYERYSKLLFNLLTIEQKQEYFLKIINTSIEEDRIDFIYINLKDILEQLTIEKQQEYSIIILNTLINKNKIEALSFHLNLFTDSFTTEQKEEYSLKIINASIDQNKVEKLDYYHLCKLFELLPDKQKQEYSLKIINAYIDQNKINNFDMKAEGNLLFTHLTAKQKKKYGLKVINAFIEPSNEKK